MVRAEPATLCAIAIGGALGASARYGLTQLVHLGAAGFPWATFGINVSGSFLLGLLLAATVSQTTNRYIRPFASIGVLGAFTTYSTFAVESDLLVKDGHAVTAVAYGIGSLVLGLGAVSAGSLLGRNLSDRVRP